MKALKFNWVLNIVWLLVILTANIGNWYMYLTKGDDLYLFYVVIWAGILAVTVMIVVEDYKISRRHKQLMQDLQELDKEITKHLNKKLEEFHGLEKLHGSVSSTDNDIAPRGIGHTITPDRE